MTTPAITVVAACVFAVWIARLLSDTLAAQLLQMGSDASRRVVWRTASWVAIQWFVPLLVLAVALLIDLQARTKWFTENPTGVIAGYGIGCALGAAFLWDLIKSAPARYRQRIFASLEHAIPSGERVVLNQRKDGMLSDGRGQHETAVDAVLSHYCPRA